MKRIDKWILSAIAVALFAAVLVITTRPEAATWLSEQLALNRLERYARPTPVNATAELTDAVMAITYGGEYADSVYIVADGDTISAYLGDTLDAEFPGIAQGDSAEGPWIATVCAAIDAYADYDCDPVAGGDYLAPAAFLDAETVDITDGGDLILDADYIRSMSLVIPAQGGSLSLYLSAVAGYVDGAAAPAAVTIYSGLSRAAAQYTVNVADYASTIYKSDQGGHFIFPGPGLVLPANTAAVIRLSAGDTISAGQLSVSATSHGY